MFIIPNWTQDSLFRRLLSLFRIEHKVRYSEGSLFRIEHKIRYSEGCLFRIEHKVRYSDGS